MALHTIQPMADHGLSRSRRLLRAAEFGAVYARGRSVAGRVLVMWVLGSDRESTRLGVVASKRALRRAVDRNRAKRLLRESFRLHRTSLRGGLDMVLIARRGIGGCRRQDVDRDLIRAARRHGIWETQIGNDT